MANLLLPLRVRLAMAVTLMVTVVVGASTYLELHLFESSLRSSLIETATSTAQEVADDVELRTDPLADRAALADSLHEFIQAVPSIRGLAVVSLEGGQPDVLASTSSAERPEAVAAARSAYSGNEMILSGDGPLRLVAVPARHDDRLFGAVVATYSVASITELRRRGRAMLLWFVPAAILLLTLFVDLAARWLIHRPIGRIGRTMRRVRGGDLAARAPVLRNDEIGELARGLNEMLASMENFNVELQDRVREATTELREKNVELRASYERVIGLREALARADQLAAVGQMAASVAHQIGTPLNVISGYVQMIREQEGPRSRVIGRLEIVEEQIAKVASIVRTMLDHTRRQTSRQPTDLGQLLRRVCDVAEPKLAAANVRLELSVSPLPAVMADAVQLELALLNLVTNGLDAMPSGGTMSITAARSEPGGVRIQVADTGTGIAPELLPHIFDPWVTTKETGRGTGLGLSIVRDVVSSHGGTVAARSDPGAGTVIVIELPPAPPDAGAGEPAAACS